MLSDAESVEEYLEQLPDDWRRETLQDLRSIISQEAPNLSEVIHYKMLGYCLEGDFAFHLNVQRNYVSYYVGDASSIDPTGELLEGLSVGKGCIRFTKTKAVGETKIRQFIRKAVAVWDEAGRTGC